MTEISTHKNKHIMQHFKVTMARHELSAIEMRIMAMVVLKLKDAQIQGYNKDVKDVSDLFDKFNRVTINNADIVVAANYSEVRKALKSLTKRDIELKKDNGTYFFNLVREAYYSDDKTQIDIDVSPHILPELIEIGKNYTKFGLEFLFKTKSAHAIRWYQIGCHWLKNGISYISKDEIRELFKVQNKYKLHRDFQKWLITEPLKEVNEKSDINLSIVKTHKKNKVIIGYTFAVSKKEKENKIEDLTSNLLINSDDFLKKYLKIQEFLIIHLCEKYNYDYDLLLSKLKNRELNIDIKNQKHFNNLTNRYIAKILADESQTKLTIDQISEQLKFV